MHGRPTGRRIDRFARIESILVQGSDLLPAILAPALPHQLQLDLLSMQTSDLTHLDETRLRGGVAKDLGTPTNERGTPQISTLVNKVDQSSLVPSAGPPACLDFLNPLLISSAKRAEP